MNKQKLLVFETRMMGDAILSLPFIRSAAKNYKVYIACSNAGRNVYCRVMADDRIICWDPPWNQETAKYSLLNLSKSKPLLFLKAIQQIMPDIAVTPLPDPRIELFMALSGARKRIGFALNKRNYYAWQRPWRKRQMIIGHLMSLGMGIALGRSFLTEILQRRNCEQHHVDDWKQIAESLDLLWDTRLPWLSCPETDKGITKQMHMIAASAHKMREPLLIVHAGARTPNRHWSLDNYQEVLDRFRIERKMQVIAIQSPEVRFTPGFLKNTLLVAADNFDELCAVLNLDDVVLCNDSGVGHLAAALGKKVIAIFTSQKPCWFAPYGNEDLAVVNPACPHYPCLNHCVMPSYVCLAGVQPAHVLEKLSKFMDRWEDSF